MDYLYLITYAGIVKSMELVLNIESTHLVRYTNNLVSPRSGQISFSVLRFLALMLSSSFVFINNTRLLTARQLHMLIVCYFLHII